MRGSNLWAAIRTGGAFLVFSMVAWGCGNPEAPEITNVRLSYWDSLADEGTWVPFEDGGIAPESSVRIQGNITDNTAVVNPKITWIGERNDVDEEGFTECSNGTDEFFSCDMSCEGPSPDGYFECVPALDARELIRGDRFVLTGSKADEETFEVQVSVSEAQKLTDNEEAVDTEYRIFRVAGVEGDSRLVWSVYQKTTGCRIWKPEEGRCGVPDASGAWRPLRSGDSLCWDPSVEGDGACSFRIALKQAEGDDAIASVSAAWKSLGKWNDESFLNWEAKTGNFDNSFQLFDPRLRDPDSGEVVGGAAAPTYRFLVSAQDVPDQKTDVYRSSEVKRSLVFSPLTREEAGGDLPPPDLQVDGEDEDRIEATDPVENRSGSVTSFSGEVRSLVLRLSGGALGDRSHSYYFDPQAISLLGNFTATLVFVSDWNGDGVVDEPDEEGGIPNNLEVLALDVLGNWTRKTVPIVFVPETANNKPPEVQIREIFPPLDKDDEALLPFGEPLRVRARAADDQGQPSFSAWECPCEADEPMINAERCSCNPETGETGNPWVDLNVGGEFPVNPWEWIDFQPADKTRKSFGVLMAREKAEELSDIPAAQSSGLEIAFEPSPDEDGWQVSVSLPETQGPNVILNGLKNGDIVDPDEFRVNATIYANVSELNEIKALWNGKPRGEPTFDLLTGAFSWDLTAFSVKEGDRICVGATSVTGHATFDILEFAAVSDGLLLAVTVTSDMQECELNP